jgi:hypothetical protein
VQLKNEVSFTVSSVAGEKTKIEKPFTDEQDSKQQSRRTQQLEQ